MSKVQWLGDPIADCKASVANKLLCESFAGTVSIATASYPLQQFYKDQCIEYLCSKGSMPDSPQDLPQPPGCKDDQANKDKCAAFGSALAATTGAAPLGPFFRDQCLEYLCAQGKMPTPGDMPLPPPPVPPPQEPPQTKPSTPLAPAGAAPTKETPWGWIVAGTAAALGLVWFFAPQTRPWKENPWTRSLSHETTAKLMLARVILNQGGYDARGRYWGVGAPLYAAQDDDGNMRYVRAATREEAKRQFPKAKWYR